jgi:hypothetical protein
MVTLHFLHSQKSCSEKSPELYERSHIQDALELSSEDLAFKKFFFRLHTLFRLPI